MEIGELIHNYRMSKGISMREFARRCGLSSAYIVILEKGVNPSTGEKMTPTVQSLKKLADGMHMSFNDLVAMTDDDYCEQDEPEPVPEEKEKSTFAGQDERASDLRLQLIDFVMNAPEESLNKLLQIIQMFMDK